MGCSFSCFKSVDQDAETSQHQSRHEVESTRASGAPGSNVNAVTNGSKTHCPADGVRYSMIATGGTSALRSSFSDSGAIVEAVGNVAANSGKEKLPAPIDWVIGLDFGTTFSGFAYARMEEDPDIHVYYNWPVTQNERSYCKTLTGLYYKRPDQFGSLECASWGYPARSEYKRVISSQSGPSQGQMYLTKFKLLLKPASLKNDPAQAVVIPPPPPLTRDTIITDYLKGIGGLALQVLQSHVGDAKFKRDSVLWCVTVPSIWDDGAKQKMKEYMVRAKLVDDADAVRVVLEPEAASFHCHNILRRDHRDVGLKARDKILVVDAGGGTVDIVAQQLIASGDDSEFKVKELTESSGGLCGGTFVDERFMNFLSQKIGCLEEFLRDYPSYHTTLLQGWENIKCGFGHEMMSSADTIDINLHHKLAPKWEAYEADKGRKIRDSSVVVLTNQDLQSIFNPVVDEILDLIAAQLRQVPDIKVMFVVGGFAGSPYLMKKIRDRFRSRVSHIVSPANPGSAIVQGAVALALHPEAVVSRIAKKTYGTSVMRSFDPKLDPLELLKVTNGTMYCGRRFDVFVKKGTEVEANNLCVSKEYVPLDPHQKQIMFDLFSSTEQDPRFAVASDTVTNEGEVVVDLPTNRSRDDPLPRYEFSMYFGLSVIELKAGRKVTESRGQVAKTLSVPVKYSSVY